MKYTIKNNTGQDTSTLNKMVDAYFPYAQKNKGFDMSVTIMFESDMENAKTLWVKQHIMIHQIIQLFCILTIDIQKI